LKPLAVASTTSKPFDHCASNFRRTSTLSPALSVSATLETPKHRDALRRAAAFKRELGGCARRLREPRSLARQ
jgi:hypothetical protein